MSDRRPDAPGLLTAYLIWVALILLSSVAHIVMDVFNAGGWK